MSDPDPRTPHDSWPLGVRVASSDMEGQPAGSGADEIADGRRARGTKRRQQIIDATLRVVTRDGAAGVTHRAVAVEAGITTSLTTYHFATLDELLVASLSSVADTYTQRVRRIIDSDGDQLGELAAFIAESDGAGRAMALAERELATMAARRPVLRPLAHRWRDDVAELGGHLTDDPLAVAALVATAEGLCTAILLGDGSSDPDYLRSLLSRAVSD